MAIRTRVDDRKDVSRWPKRHDSLAEKTQADGNKDVGQKSQLKRKRAAPLNGTALGVLFCSSVAYSAAGQAQVHVSHAQVSQGHALLSQVSTAHAASSTQTLSLSQPEPCSVFWPQEAKDTATTAANKNANFFIFFAFLNL